MLCSSRAWSQSGFGIKVFPIQIQNSGKKRNNNTTSADWLTHTKTKRAGAAGINLGRGQGEVVHVSSVSQQDKEMDSVIQI